MLAGPMLRQRRPASSALSTLAVGTWADRLAAPARSARETIREPRTRAGKRFMRDSQVEVGHKSPATRPRYECRSRSVDPQGSADLASLPPCLLASLPPKTISPAP